MPFLPPKTEITKGFQGITFAKVVRCVETDSIKSSPALLDARHFPYLTCGVYAPAFVTKRGGSEAA